MQTLIAAVYEDLSVAYFVVLNLSQRGFDRNAISLVAEDLRDRSEDSESVRFLHKAKTTMPEWADYGVLTESLAGILEGLTTLSTNGVGPVIAAGPVAHILRTTTEVASDGLAAALTHFNLTENQAETFTGAIQQGKALVAIKVDADQAERANSTMKAFAPIRIEYRYSDPEAAGSDPEKMASSPAVTDMPTTRRPVDPDDTRPSRRRLAEEAAFTRR